MGRLFILFIVQSFFQNNIAVGDFLFALFEQSPSRQVVKSVVSVDFCCYWSNEVERR
jgi:hypothetical protein